MVIDSVTHSPVAGATVKVAKYPTTTVTTGANGTYLLQISTSAGEVLTKSKLLSLPVLKNNRVLFGVAHNDDRVRIDLHALDGRRVATLVNGKLASGNYQVAPFEHPLAGQAYILKLQIGDQSSTFKLTNLGGTIASSGARHQSANAVVENGVAKVQTAVIDTLIVSDGGYHLAAKTPITSYTGVHNFTLIGDGGMEIQNSSYRGCDTPMYVTLLDLNLAGASAPATVPVKIISKADPIGITALFKKVPGQVGFYDDSIDFSIKQSDSATRTIKVMDKDSIWAIYSDPLAQRFASSSTWLGTLGVFTNGSIYLGCRTKARVCLYDPDVTDSSVMIHVWSGQADTVGINLKCNAFVDSTQGRHYGLFVGYFTFSPGPSQGDSVLHVNSAVDNEVNWLYHDQTPLQDVLSMVCTWKPALALITLDSTAYHGTSANDTMHIVLADEDITDSSVAVKITSKNDPTGISDTLKRDANLGTFVGNVGFTTSASHAGFISVQNADSVIVSYLDDSPIRLVTASARWNSDE